jgi:ribosomal-protein-alanine N-acetyltransferase
LFFAHVQIKDFAQAKKEKKFNANMDTAILRPMIEEDLPIVLAIEESSFLSPWTRASFVHELHNPHGALTVAARQEQILGYLCCWYVVDEVQIVDIAVHPSHRRQRIGECLLRYALETGRQRGAQSAHLEVRRSNRSAIALYQKLGFSEVAVRRRYYANGEDALLMSCQLSSQTEE